VVVKVGVVGLDALEEQIARLLEKGVDREIEKVKGGVRGQLRRVSLNVVERGRQGNLGRLRWWRRYLVQERGEKVSVVDYYGDLDEDVLEGQLGLLQTVRLC
jgi:hypothetical protein